MRNHSWAVRFLSILLVIVVPVALIGADSQGAMVYGKGDIRINGNTAAGGSSAIYVGDSVQTAKHSTATVSSAGTIISLDENSNLAFGGNDLKVTTGHAVVTTTKGTVAHFANLAITPASDRAKFVVQQAKGKYDVAALNGPIMVSDGVNSMVLETGKMMTRVDGQEPAPPPPASNKKKGGAILGLPGWEVALISAGVAGAVLGGLAAAGELGGKEESPSHR